MTGMVEASPQKAVTGLEGGLVASGSTCGVVTAGALGIALMRHRQRRGSGEVLKRRTMDEARAFAGWFEHNFRTTLCRERTSVDFYRAGGQLTYLLPVRFGRCLRHSGMAAAYLRSLAGSIPAVSGESAGDPQSEAVHCATEVLRGVRAACGVGDSLVEEISYVLDGGVALSGGVCGAVTGAVMAVNLAYGWNIRAMSYRETVREFVRGHVNLLRKSSSGRPETFAIGKDVIGRLGAATDSFECSRITGRSFSLWDDFQSHVQTFGPCRELVARSVEAACEAIARHRPL
jgi:hypothetical protein